MKKILILAFTAISSLSHAQCPGNGDLEWNNLNNWTGYIGTSTNSTQLNLASFIPGFNPTQHVLQNVGFDPNVNTLPTIFENNHAVRIGNMSPGFDAALLSYTFIVDNSNMAFRFSYALVMDEPGVHPGQNPFFMYWFSTTNNLVTSMDPNNIIGSPETIMSEKNDVLNLFDTLENVDTLVFTPWIPVCFDLSNYIGQQVTVYFLSSDCKLGGHLGYAYIDALCTNPDIPLVADLQCPTNIFCSSTGVMVYGNGSTGYDSYEWLIKNLATGNIATKSANKPIIGGTNVGTIYVSQFGSMPDGQYEITLRVKNCNQVVEEKCIVTIFQPLIEAENVYMCCNSGTTTLDIVASMDMPYGTTGVQLEWYDEDLNYLGTGNTSITGNTVTSTLTVNVPTLMTRYKVMYSTATCLVKKWVTAFTMPDNAAAKIKKIYNCNCQPPQLQGYFAPQTCNNVDVDPQDWEEWRDFLIDNGYVQWQWNTLATTQTITYDPNYSTYQVTANWPCGTNTSFSTTVPPNILQAGFDPLTHTATMSPTSDFVIFAQPPSSPFAYDAFEYRLRIYDQWGNMIYEKHENSCAAGLPSGFPNGHIRWNGILNNGNRPNRPDTYMFYLQLKNCSKDDISTNSSTYQGSFDYL